MQHFGAYEKYIYDILNIIIIMILKLNIERLQKKLQLCETSFNFVFGFVACSSTPVRLSAHSYKDSNNKSKKNNDAQHFIRRHHHQRAAERIFRFISPSTHHTATSLHSLLTPSLTLSLSSLCSSCHSTALQYSLQASD